MIGFIFENHFSIKNSLANTTMWNTCNCDKKKTIIPVAILIPQHNF